MAEQTSKKLRFLKFFIVIIVSCIIISAIFFFSAGKILSFPESKPKKSDLIVVLGGSSEFRILKALELFISDYAQKVLFMNLTKPPKIFSDSDIAEKSIICGVKAQNSWDEGVKTLELMKSKDWKSVIVVTDPPHLLRVEYAWDKIFEKSGMEFTLVATDLFGWNANKWWKNNFSRRWVISEYLKLAYFIYMYHTSGVRGKVVDEKKHEQMGKIEKKWEDQLNGWVKKAVELVGSKQ